VAPVVEVIGAAARPKNHHPASKTTARMGTAASHGRRRGVTAGLRDRLRLILVTYRTQPRL